NQRVGEKGKEDDLQEFMKTLTRLQDGKGASKDEIQSGRFDFDSKDSTARDVFHECAVDDGVRNLCELVGNEWLTSFDRLVSEGYKPPKGAESRRDESKRKKQKVCQL